jgi:hypothetical protein
VVIDEGRYLGACNARRSACVAGVLGWCVASSDCLRAFQLAGKLDWCVLIVV